MELEARNRKERLLKLKQRSSNPEDPEVGENGLKDHEKEVREESPTQEDSRKRPNDSTIDHPTVEKVVEGISEALITEQKKKFKEEVSLANLAPTKPNWDLKRDVEKKLQKLERRTQVKIHEIVRERIRNQEGKQTSQAITTGQEFLEAIDNQTKLDRKVDEDED